MDRPLSLRAKWGKARRQTVPSRSFFIKKFVNFIRFTDEGRSVVAFTRRENYSSVAIF